jgi:hypothetical protein
LLDWFRLRVCLTEIIIYVWEILKLWTLAMDCSIFWFPTKWWKVKKWGQFYHLLIRASQYIANNCTCLNKKYFLKHNYMKAKCSHLIDNNKNVLFLNLSIWAFAWCDVPVFLFYHSLLIYIAFFQFVIWRCPSCTLHNIIRSFCNPISCSSTNRFSCMKHAFFFLTITSVLFSGLFFFSVQNFIFI